MTFQLADGELLGVIGPNGAGKTTLFDLLTGFTPADGGHVLLRGDDVTAAPAHRRARLGLGRTFQDARLWPSLTVRECLAVASERNLTSRDPLSAVLAPADASGRAKRAAEARADELIELVGLQHFADKFLSELSTGSRRMVEIACLLANGASHPAARRAVVGHRPARGRGPRARPARPAGRSSGASIVLIEHDMPLLTGVADRLLALDTGAVVTDGDADDVLTHPHVVASYLGDARRAGSDREPMRARRRPSAWSCVVASGRASRGDDGQASDRAPGGRRAMARPTPTGSSTQVTTPDCTSDRGARRAPAVRTPTS